MDQKKVTVVPAITLQYWTTTEYLDKSRYNLLSRTLPQAFWSAIYKDVLSDLKESKRPVNADPLLNADVKSYQLAQIGVMEVLAWSTLVNTFW